MELKRIEQPPTRLEQGSTRPERRVVYVVRGRRALWDRGPLPPGHALSWGAITQGTVLEEAAYPYPVFPW